MDAFLPRRTRSPCGCLRLWLAESDVRKLFGPCRSNPSAIVQGLLTDTGGIDAKLEQLHRLRSILTAVDYVHAMLTRECDHLGEADLPVRPNPSLRLRTIPTSISPSSSLHSCPSSTPTPLRLSLKCIHRKRPPLLRRLRGHAHAAACWRSFMHACSGPRICPCPGQRNPPFRQRQAGGTIAMFRAPDSR